MVSLTRRKSHDDGGKTKKVKINRGGNPTARPWLVRIWGMLGALIISLGFIVIIIYLQKTLPDGSKSRFHPSWRRNVAAREGVAARDPSLAPQILSFVGVGPLAPRPTTSSSSSTPPATTDFAVHPIIIPPILSLPCFSSQVDCSTIQVPGKLRARYEEVTCSTNYVEIPCLTAPTSTPPISIPPIRTILHPLCYTSTVTCPPIIKERLIGRQLAPGCYSTGFYGLCATSPTSTTSSLPLGLTRIPSGCLTSVVSCTTFAANIQRAEDGVEKRQLETACSTSYSYAPCSTSISTLTTSSPPFGITRIPSGCLSSAVLCTTFPLIPRAEDNLGKRQMETACSTSYSYAPCTTTSSSFSSSTVTTSSPTTSSSPTPTTPGCLSSTVLCTTVPIIIPRTDGGLERRQFQTDCSTSYTYTSCSINTSSVTSTTSSPTTTSSTSINSCIASTVSCPDVIGKRQTDCSTFYSTISGCGTISLSSSSSVSTTSASITSSSSDSCITSTVSCPDVIGKRQAPTDCSTSYFTMSSCRVFTTSSGLSSTLSSSSRVSSSSIITSSPTYQSTALPESASNSTSSGFSSGLSSSSLSLAPASASGSSTTPTSSTPTSMSSSMSSQLPVLIISPSSIQTSSSSSSSGIPTPGSSGPSSLNSSSGILTSRPSGFGSTFNAPTSPTPSASLPIASLGSPSSPSPSLGGTSTSPTSPTHITAPSLSSPFTESPTITPSTLPPESPFPAPSSPTLPLPVPSASGSPSGFSTTPSSSLSLSTLPLHLFSGDTTLLSITPLSSPSVSSSTSISSGSKSKPSASSTTSPSVSSSLPTYPLTNSTSTNSFQSLLQSAEATGTLLPSNGGGGGAGGNSGPQGNGSDINKSSSPSPDIYPLTQVIVGNYLPLIISRSFVAILTSFYHQILLHEPIRQLTNRGGASFATLSGSPGILTPVYLAIGAAQIGSAFTAGAIFTDVDYCDTPGACLPRLSVNSWIMDILLTVLIIQVIIILTIIQQWWRKPNSMSADPTSIAGVAVVMGHPQIEAEFSSFPADMSKGQLAKELKGKKFRLGIFTTENGIEKYGIMPKRPAATSDSDSRTQTPVKEGFKDKLRSYWLRFKTSIPFFHNWRRNSVIFDSIFGMLLLALLGLTAAALSKVGGTQVDFLATAAAEGMGMRIFFAVLGVIVSMYWGQLFQDMQTLTPYSLLSTTAAPHPTILLKKHTFPLTAFLPLLYNCHYVAGFAALTGLIAEFLVIALAGLPYRPGQQRGEFLFWAVVALAILGLMIIMLVVMNIWRRKLPALERMPGDIAAVMTYVAGTGMVRDFEELSQVSTKERDRAIERLGKAYAYGWRREEMEYGVRAGRGRWVVDEALVKERNFRRVENF